MTVTPSVLFEFAAFCATDLNCDKNALFKQISDYLSYKNKQDQTTNVDDVLALLKKMLNIREFDVKVEPSETDDQIAAIWLLHGSDAQKENALKYARGELPTSTTSEELASKNEATAIWEPPLIPKPEPCALLKYGEYNYSIPYTLMNYIVGWVTMDSLNTMAPKLAVKNTLDALRNILDQMTLDCGKL